MKEIYGQYENIVQSQVQIKDLHNLKGQLLLIITHPWDRLVTLYKSYYEKFNYNYYLLYGLEMAKHQPLKAIDNFEWRQPLFTDFINYLINHKNDVLQWSPIVDICPVCNYEFEYVIDLKSIENLDTSNTHKYMSQLNASQIEKLKHIYWNDFVVFEYDSNKYIYY